MAQPGSALRWGCRGRGFKSRRSDRCYSNMRFSLGFKIFPAPVLLSFVFVVISQGLLVAFLPLYAPSILENSFFIGALYSSYFFGMLVGSLSIEKWLDQYGQKLVLCILFSILPLTTVLMSLLRDPVTWVLMRCVAGVAMGGSFIVCEMCALTVAENKRRPALAVYFFTLYGGMTLGASLIKLHTESTTIDHHAASLYFFTLLFFQCLSVLFSSLIKPMHMESSPGIPYLSLAKKILPSIIIAFMGGSLIGSASAHIPSFSASMGYSMSYTSIFVTVAVTGGALACFPAARIAQWQGDMRTILTFMLGGIFCDSIFANFDLLPSWSTLAVLFVAVGSGYPLYMLSLSRASLESKQTKDFVRFAAVLGIAFSCGAVFGPMFSSAFIQSNTKGLFWSNIFLKAVIVLYLIFSSELKKKKLCTSNDSALNAAIMGQSSIFSGAIRRSVGKKNRKRIDKRVKKG